MTVITDGYTQYEANGTQLFRAKPGASPLSYSRCGWVSSLLAYGAPIVVG